MTNRKTISREHLAGLISDESSYVISLLWNAYREVIIKHFDLPPKPINKKDSKQPTFKKRVPHSLPPQCE